MSQCSEITRVGIPRRISGSPISHGDAFGLELFDSVGLRSSFTRLVMGSGTSYSTMAGSSGSALPPQYPMFQTRSVRRPRLPASTRLLSVSGFYVYVTHEAR